jgi:hypothetical protein
VRVSGCGLNSELSARRLLLARTRRKSHLLTMSEVPPAPDLRARMSGILLFSSGLPPGPEVPGAPGKRGVLTQRRHLALTAKCSRARSVHPIIGHHIDSNEIGGSKEPPLYYPSTRALCSYFARGTPLANSKRMAARILRSICR